MTLSFMIFVSAALLSQAHAADLQYKQPNFYDQSQALQKRNKPPLPAGEWPDAIAPQVDSPRQSPRTVDSNAIDSGYAFEGQADKRAKGGEVRQICKNSGSEKPECRSYEYHVAPPGKVPYEAPAWKLLQEEPKTGQ